MENDLLLKPVLLRQEIVLQSFRRILKGSAENYSAFTIISSLIEQVIARHPQRSAYQQRRIQWWPRFTTGKPIVEGTNKNKKYVDIICGQVP
jgi:hypothetical protein